jgi:hypothetical protein
VSKAAVVPSAAGGNARRWRIGGNRSATEPGGTLPAGSTATIGILSPSPNGRQPFRALHEGVATVTGIAAGLSSLAAACSLGARWARTVDGVSSTA